MKKDINMKSAISSMKKIEDAKRYIKSSDDSCKTDATSWMLESLNERRQELTVEKDKYIKATQKLQNEINDVQKRSKVRTITVDQIVNTLIEIDNLLEIPVKAKEGLFVEVDVNAQNFPRAYKYTPESTHFYAAFSKGSWRVVDIRRETTLREKSRIVIHHTTESKNALIERFSCIE